VQESALSLVPACAFSIDRKSVFSKIACLFFKKFGFLLSLIYFLKSAFSFFNNIIDFCALYFCIIEKDDIKILIK
jgi:hypothetical protein